MSSYALNRNYKLQLPVGTHLANHIDGVDGSTDGRLSYTTCQMVWK